MGTWVLINAPWYQLRVGSDGKVIIAVEPRWNHPELGRIGPDRFLRVAEQSGLIVPLGDWTLQAGCQMAARWPGATVAIPLYPKQLLASDVPEMLNLALRECGVSPERVELHLERGMARINPDDLQEQLAELRDIGATLVMDNLLMHEDALVTQQGWRVDRVVVDRRLRNLLLRRSSALAPRLDEALAAASAAAPGHQRVELDATGDLLTFALLDDAEDNDLTMALSQTRGDHLQLQA
ncbi:EAL domain-containing protein [Novosphingobium decolorationis]|uniref:EAL domain-containing protein n=1 Tax=Novosphingobium decolorationis TaxID=2698673 RepID=A0ABX8E570_9SPHN|nr:EAL domain-containing protein [Novosphingobium decolorationis]QVM84330.1 EAL domain-containing protein [Novosphingobium decolorationis]